MRAGISLGSNLGDRAHQVRSAIRHLVDLSSPGPPPLVSSLYESAPVNCPPDSNAFINAVVEIEWSQSPLDLLDHLQKRELEAGRPASRPKNAPRPLDLDLLYLDNLVINLPRLILPHPEIANRAFVLQPLAEIRPNLVFPGFKENVSVLLAAVKSECRKI